MLRMPTIGGTLSMVVYGFHAVVSDAVLDGEVPAKSPSICDQLRVDVTLQPEKQCILTTSIDKQGGTDGCIQAMWNSHANFPFSYSQIQRSVSFVSIRVTEQCSKKKLLNRSVAIGSATVDLCGLVFKQQTCICVLPIYPQTASTAALVDASAQSSIVGWLVIGFCIDGAVKSIESQCAAVWSAMTEPLVAPLVSQPSTLCILTATLQSYTLVAKADPDVSLEIGYLSVPESQVSSLAVSRDLLCSPTQALMHIEAYLPGAAAIIELRLIESGSVVGRAVVALASAWLRDGKPVDITVPLRNLQGERVCLLPLAIQTSHIAAVGDRAASTAPAPMAQEELCIDLSQANILDAAWRFDMELSFECCLTFFLARDSDPPRSFYGRSNKAILPGSQRQDSAMCSLSIDVIPLEEVDSVVLSIVCRDSARPNYPEVGRGKLDVKQMLCDASVAPKSLQLSPPEDNVGAGKLFARRADIRSSLLVGLHKNPSALHTSPHPPASDAVANIRLYLTSLSDDAGRSVELRRLTVTSSIGKTQFRRWSNIGEHFASVSVAGSEGELRIEAEVQPSGTLLTGLLPLDGIFTLSNSMFSVPLLGPISQLNAQLRAVVIPLVVGRLAINYTAYADSKLGNKQASYFLKLGADGFPLFTPLQLSSSFASFTLPPPAATNMGITIDSSTLAERIFVTLIDTAKSIASLDKSCVVAVGAIDIDGLLYDALKNCCHRSETDPLKTILGSAAMSRPIELYDSNKSKLLTVQANILFVIDSVAPAALAAVAHSQNKATVNIEDSTRTEVGLKQAFVAADADNTGSVTYDEVVAVFKKRLSTKSSAKRVKSAALADPFDLLLRLGNADVDTSDMSEAAILSIVSTVLKRLDLDGDGQVSWEEWLHVLSATLIERNPNSLINPSDAYIIRLLGAASALKKGHPSPLSATLVAFSEYHKIIIHGFIKSKSKPNSNFVSSILSLRSLSDTLNTTTLHNGIGAIEEEPLGPETIDANHLSRKTSVLTFSQTNSTMSLSKILNANLDNFDVVLSKNYKDLRKKNKMKRVRQSLTKFVNKMVPRLHNEIFKRKMAILTRVLWGIVVRYKYKKKLQLRYASVVKLQSTYRGVLSRRREKARYFGAVALQKAVRGYRASKYARELSKLRVLMLWNKKKRAELIMKRVVIKWLKFWRDRRAKAAAAIQAASRRRAAAVKAKKDRAAALIQTAYRSKVARITQAAEHQKHLVEELQKHKEKQLLEEKSAVAIQKTVRGRKGKQEAAKLRGDKLVAAEASRKAEVDAKLAKQQKDEHASASKIQKLYRTKYGQAKPGLASSAELPPVLTVPELQTAPPIEKSYGWTVLVPVGKSLEDGVHCGKVIGFSRSSNFVRIQFETEEGEKPFIGDVSYVSSTLLWKEPPAVDVPLPNQQTAPLLDASLGWIVLVMIGASIESGLHCGKVVGYSRRGGFVRVKFETEDEEKPFIEDVPYSSPKLIWKEAPHISALIPRHPPIRECIGYTVEVALEQGVAASTDADGGCYVGKVSAINIQKNTIRIDFEVQDDDPPDSEEFSITSSRILKWIAPKPAPLPVKTMPRPVLENTVGCEVYIGHEDDPDMRAKVIDFDKKLKILQIEFAAGAHGPAHVDSIPYTSREIRWVAPHVPVPSAAPTSAAADRSPGTHTAPEHPPIEDFVGCVVYVGDENNPDVLGHIISFNAEKKAVTVAFLDDDLEDEEFSFDSPEIKWIRTQVFDGDDSAHDKVAQVVGYDREKQSLKMKLVEIPTTASESTKRKVRRNSEYLRMLQQ